MPGAARRGPLLRRYTTGSTLKAHTLTDDFRTLDTAKWPTRTNVSVNGWRGRLDMPQYPARPAFVKQATGESADGTTGISATFGSAPTSGNLLVACIAGDKNTGTLTLTGWTILYSLPSTSTSLYLCHRTSDGTETTVSGSTANASAGGTTMWVGEYSQTGAGAWTVRGQASSITDETNVTSKTTGTTGAVTGYSRAVAMATVDSSASVTSPSWSNGFTARYSTPSTQGNTGAVFVAEGSGTSGAPIDSTFTYTGTADQTSAAVVAFSRAETPANSVLSTDPLRYDLTSSSVYVELATLPTHYTSSVYLAARNSLTPENHVLIGREGASLLMRKVEAGTVSDTTLTYDYTFHRWVRLRHDGTNLIWETSNNGSMWTVRRTTTTTINLASVTINLEGVWLGTTGAGRGEVAWLNSPPVTALTYDPPPMHFGTLITLPAEAAGEYTGGCRVHMQEFWWNSYETSDNVWSTSERDWKNSELDSLQATGARITMGLGLASAPTYVGSLANAKYVDAAGNVSSNNNFVFNQLVRDKAERYIARVNTEIGLSNYWAIRLTSGGSGEVLYPAQNAFWAYDTNAQTGAPNLPTTVAPCPYPGWRPGETTITTTQAREWAEWYIASLVDSANWCMRYIRSLGFTGWFEIICPGSGTRPSQWETDIAARLSGATGTTGIGAVWHKVVEKLVDRHGVVFHCSSFAEQSGSPANNVSTAADAAVSITDSAANNWSAMRWMYRLGHEYEMQNNSETPGYGDTSNPYYEDTTSTGMLAAAQAQLQAANSTYGPGYLAHYHAHSNNLHGGGGTLTMANYTTRITNVNGGTNPSPPNPP
jgi:hypothetical protein